MTDEVTIALKPITPCLTNKIIFLFMFINKNIINFNYDKRLVFSLKYGSNENKAEISWNKYSELVTFVDPVNVWYAKGCPFGKNTENVIFSFRFIAKSIV